MVSVVNLKIIFKGTLSMYLPLSIRLRLGVYLLGGGGSGKVKF